MQGMENGLRANTKVEMATTDYGGWMQDGCCMESRDGW